MTDIIHDAGAYWLPSEPVGCDTLLYGKVVAIFGLNMRRQRAGFERTRLLPGRGSFARGPT